MPDGDKVPHVQQADPSVSILCHSNSPEVSLEAGWWFKINSEQKD